MSHAIRLHWPKGDPAIASGGKDKCRHRDKYISVVLQYYKDDCQKYISV